MASDRPPCAICGGEVPLNKWTEADHLAELECSAATGEPYRDIFDTVTCFGIARDREVGKT